MGAFAALARQFGHPTGPVGHLAGWIMAARSSNRARNAWTVELLDIGPAHRVLELGFGPGYALSLVAPRLTTGCIVGLDHSSAMLAQARRRNRDWIADGRMQLVQGGPEALATLPRGFDRLYSANFIQFIADPAALLQNLRALMVKGARIGMTYQPRHPGATDADALQFADRLLVQMQAARFQDCSIARNHDHGVLTVCVLGRTE